jgi:hypothetical protein
VLLAGLGVGVATSFGQTELSGAVHAYANSASSWLVAPFVLGVCMATLPGAAVAGASVCLLQLVGYYVTAHERGYPAGSRIVLFWLACAVAGGPVFGAAGYVWRTAAPAVRGVGPATLAGAFVAEGLWVYLHELHYNGTTVLWLATAAVLALVLMRGLDEYRWLALTIPVGIGAEMLLTHVYNQTF